MSLQFNGSFSDKLKQITEEVYINYPELHDYTINIDLGFIKASTMYARPVFKLETIWNGFQTYRLKVAHHVRDSEHLKVEDLKTSVLKGWIAHEMGHLVDYLDKSIVEMAVYGFRYIWSKEFAREVEHRADEIAVHHGFYQNIKATKQFLFYHKDIHPSYSEKMKSTYMSLENLELCNTNYERNILKD